MNAPPAQGARPRLFRGAEIPDMTCVFHTYHPIVPFAFIACALALSMGCMHPVYVALSLAGALACSAVCNLAFAEMGCSPLPYCGGGEPVIRGIGLYRAVSHRVASRVC